jgi:hypothetical protein
VILGRRWRRYSRVASYYIVLRIQLGFLATPYAKYVRYLHFRLYVDIKSFETVPEEEFLFIFNRPSF